MVSNTREIALEQAIQKHLTGHTTEELAGAPAPVGDGPYRIGLPGDFNAQFALDTAMFWQFLETTQAKESAVAIA
jgi:type I restriction enzyme R subunit